MTCTWVPDYEGEQLPLAVVIAKQAVATWGGTTGSCANGLGDPETTDATGGISQGYAFVVDTTPDEVYTFVIEPSASATLDPDDIEPVLATANILVSAHVFKLDIVIHGALTDNAQFTQPQGYSFLVGQEVRFVVDSDGLAQSNHNWTFGGEAQYTFDHAELHYSEPVPEASYRYIYPFVDTSEAFAPAPDLYYLSNGGVEGAVTQAAGGDGSYSQRTVEVTLDLHFAVGVYTAVSLNLPFHVWEPILEVGPIHDGDDEFVPSNANADRIATGGEMGGEIEFGFSIEALIRTPRFFAWQTTTGRFCWDQTIALDHLLHYSLGTYGSVTPDPVHDGAPWPYQSVLWEAVTLDESHPLIQVFDSPEIGLFISTTSIHINDSYYTHMVFIPPDTAVGPSEPVAIQTWVWWWQQDVARSLNDPWPVIQDGFSLYETRTSEQGYDYFWWAYFTGSGY